MDITIFSYIGSSIDAATQHFIIDGVKSLISSIKILVITGVTLYIMLKSYLQMTGKTDGLLHDTFTHCIVVICITGLSLNATNYTTYLIGGVNAFADGLANTISTVAGTGSGERGIFKTLDELLLKAIEQANTCFAKMSLWDTESWDWIFSAIAVLVSLGAVTLLASVIIIGSKFLLTLLFLLGPLFLSFACFPATRRFFDGWVGKLMEICLIQVFGVAVITLSISIIDNFITPNKLDGNDINPIAISAQIAILSGITFYIIKQIPILSCALSSGFSSSVMTIKDILSPADYTKRLITKSMINPIGSDTSRQQSLRANNIIFNGAGKQENMLNDVIDEYVRNNGRR